MVKYFRKKSHSIYDNKFHLAWIVKYRKKILVGDIAYKTRDIIRQICEELQVQVLKGNVGPDHIHILVSIPPNLSVSKVMQYLKGKSSRKLQQEFPSLRKDFWGRHLWAIGYYSATSGNVTDELIMKYIEEQGKNPDDDEFFRIQP